LKTWSELGIEIPQGAAGPQVYTTCPKCGPTRKKKNVKCLSINIPEGLMLCHHCDATGSLEHGWKGQGDPFKWVQREYHKPAYTLLTSIPQEIVDWFKARGIGETTLLRNKIRYESTYMPQQSGFVDAIRFPYLRGGEVVNVKSRTLAKEFRLESNAERIFYGMDDCTGDEAILVEGEIDKLSVEEAGFINCLSVPDGAPSPKAKDYTSKFSFLEDCDVFLGKIKTFILAVDNDEPGQKLEEELARRLGKHRCKRVQWPEGCKDANDVLVKLGANELLSCLKSAREYPVDGIFEISDISRQIDILYEGRGVKGESTLWNTIDQHYTVRVGEFTVVTGIPSHGKSEFVDALMINLFRQGNWNFAVFSPENQPLERHFVKLAEKIIKKPFHIGVHERMSKEEVEAAKRWLQPAFTFVLPPDDKLTVDGILELCQYVILKKGVRGVVIDPWNEIDHKRPSGMTETEYISAALSKIRRFAREYSIHVWLVAHPTKLYKDPKTGQYPVPTPYDISGCYSADTDVLTKRGWLKHESVTLADEVCCFDLESEVLRYERPTRLWEYDVNEDLIRINAQSCDLLVTKNHRMVVKAAWPTKPSFLSRYSGSGLGRPQKFNGSWQFIKASDVKGDLLIPWCTPMAEDNPDYPISDDELRFIGWWIAEGWVSMGSVAICQELGPLAAKMDDTMEAMGHPFSGRINISGRHNEQPIWTSRLKIRGNKQATDFAKTIIDECGSGCENKRFPSFTWLLSKRQKEIIFTAYLEGDGSKNKNGDADRAHTTSSKLVDDIQRLAVELGMMSCAGFRVGAKDHHKTRYQVSMSRPNRKSLTLRKGRHIADEHYTGKVYCLTVPTGAYVVRRNGKTAICGNSAAWRNKADNCITVFRQKDSNEVDIHVQKIRFKDVGKIGMVTLKYDIVTGIYSEKED